ncbi:MAG: glycosyltransferase [Actinomycetota bacterium]|nr:glycosyltransferase [Actinomycetota bacterium]
MVPDVSVVIPTFRRETRLAFTLDALARQGLARERFEVLVVRAAGEPGQLVDPPGGLTVRFLESPAPGAGAQRNIGWRNARAPVVAFTDDDCRPSEHWLQSLLQATAGEVVVQGRTQPDPDEAHLLLGLSRSIDVTELDPWHPSCNMAYPRRLLERLGGFDEEFEAPFWGEDTDLGLRALQAGARVEFAESALVWHAVHPRPLPMAFRDARRRSWIALVVALHPEQRDALWGGVFVNRSHAALALWLVAAIALRRRPSLAAAASAPYFALHLSAGLSGRIHPRGLARLALHLPERLTLDVAELASTVAGAVRHRSLVV